MILLALTLALAHAEPGRTLAGLTLGGSEGQLCLRGSLDYGVFRHLALTAETALVPGRRWSSGLGLLVLPVDGRFWRLGLRLLPEWVVRLDGEDPRGLELPVVPGALAGRVGGRVDWLLFWGLTVTGCVDLVADGQGGRAEWGLGLSARM